MVGLKDIAELCRTSIATVSYVINRRTDMRIPEETRQRVLDMAYRLRYRTESIARPPRIGRADAIGVVFPSHCLHPCMSEIMLGIIQEASANDFVPKLFLLNEDNVTDIVRSALKQNVAGMVVTYGTGPSMKQLLQRCKRYGIRTVLVNCNMLSACDFPHFTANDSQGARLAAEALLAAGCRRLAYTTANTKQRICWQEDRASAFISAVRDNCPEATLLRIRGDEIRDWRDDNDTARLLLDPDHRPDGIFCLSDIFAYQIERFAMLHGIAIPGDISIIGYGNLPASECMPIPIATICEQLDNVGAAATKWLLDASKHDNDLHLLPVTLLKRDSLADAIPTANAADMPSPKIRKNFSRSTKCNCTKGQHK